MSELKQVRLADGSILPCVGQGTWNLGEEPANRRRELATLRWGAENGMTLIDTAEMYGDGRSESLVGEAISTLDRSKLFLVSKVYPWNAGRSDIFDCCDASLSRMGVEYLDLYLLHWRGSIPLAETVDCLRGLVARGKIRRWGVSNFARSDMEELFSIPGGEECATVQNLYHIGSRGIEYDLLPMLRERGIPLMAYSPLGHTGSIRSHIVSNDAIRTVAAAHGVTPMQVMLAFVVAQDGFFAIPRASSVEHAQANRAAAALPLSAEELALLNRAFPAPNGPTPLDVL